MRFLVSAMAASAVLLSCPAGAAEPAASEQKLTQIRYDNLVYCAAYGYNSGDYVAAHEGKDAATNTYVAADFMFDSAKELAPKLSKQPADVGVEIDKIAEDMVQKANALSDTDYDAWDLKTGTHCSGVYEGGPERDKPFTP